MTGAKQRPGAAAPLPLERYAELSAEIDAGVPEPEILEREKLTEATWVSAKAFWLKRMADEAVRKRFEVTTRYQAIFKAKRAVFEAKLRRERDRAARAKVEIPENDAMKAAERELRAPLVSQLGPINLPEAPPSTIPVPERRAPYAPPQAQAAMAAMRQAPPLAPPPMVASPPAAMPPPVAPAAVDPSPATAPQPPPFFQGPAHNRTGPVGPIPRNVLPFDEPSSHDVPAPATAAAPDTAPDPPPRRKWSTIVADASSLNEPMPFKAATSDPPAPRAAPPPFTPPTAAPQKSASLSSTMSSNEGTTQEIMPFSKNAPPAPPAVPPPAPVAGHKKQNLGATMMVDPESIDERGLPFGGAGPRTTPQPMRRSSPQPMPATTAPMPPSLADDDDEPRTKALDPSAVRAAIAAATPFGERKPSSPGFPAATPPKTAALDSSQLKPPAPSQAGPQFDRGGGAARTPKRFSINVFASLTAEIAEQPSEVEAIRRKYGITEAEHHEESQRWTEDFATNEELRKRYLGIVQRYRGYLKGRP